MEVNGKFYPMWGQFVEKKNRFIGGVLEDHDMGMCEKTEITDIRLKPNGENSAYFVVDGKDFSCGGDVSCLGITGGDAGWLTFSGYGNHIWRIKERRNHGEFIRRQSF
jgi:hypothetical protein